MLEELGKIPVIVGYEQGKSQQFCLPVLFSSFWYLFFI